MGATDEKKQQQLPAIFPEVPGGNVLLKKTRVDSFVGIAIPQSKFILDLFFFESM